jgi:hypothetical protein
MRFDEEIRPTDELNLALPAAEKAGSKEVNDRAGADRSADRAFQSERSQRHLH